MDRRRHRAIRAGRDSAKKGLVQLRGQSSVRYFYESDVPLAKNTASSSLVMSTIGQVVETLAAQSGKSEICPVAHGKRKANPVMEGGIDNLAGQKFAVRSRQANMADTSPRQLPQAPRPARQAASSAGPRVPFRGLAASHSRSFLTSSSESFISRKRTMALAITSPRQPFAQTCAIHGQGRERGKLKRASHSTPLARAATPTRPSSRARVRIDNARALRMRSRTLADSNIASLEARASRPHEASFSSSIPHCSWSRSLSTPPGWTNSRPAIAANRGGHVQEIAANPAVPRKTSAVTARIPGNGAQIAAMTGQALARGQCASFFACVHPGRPRPNILSHNTHWAVALATDSSPATISHQAQTQMVRAVDVAGSSSSIRSTPRCW